MKREEDAIEIFEAVLHTDDTCAPHAPRWYYLGITSSTEHSLLATHRSSLTTLHLPLTTYYVHHTAHYSPLTTHHLPLTTHFSLLTRHASLLQALAEQVSSRLTRDPGWFA